MHKSMKHQDLKVLLPSSFWMPKKKKATRERKDASTKGGGV